MFIAFEGIDRSGKSTLSVMFQEALNYDKSFRDSQGDLIIDPHMGNFLWTKEPMFTSDEADFLNSSSCINEYMRERVFFESRLKHQETLACSNVVCDRYTWSGISYAKMYSPGCYEFVKEMYMESPLFIQSDLHVFVDTPVEVCHERDPSEEAIEVLRDRRDAYYATMKYIKTPIIVLESCDPPTEVLKTLISRFHQALSISRSHLVQVR